MIIDQLTQEQCRELLSRSALGRLGCSHNDQPYVVPVYFAYEGDFLYLFSTFGEKINWMRHNPKVCVEVDDIVDQLHWTSVVVTGEYEELGEPQFTDERAHARHLLLGGRQQWWLNAFAERRVGSASDLEIEPTFFRIRLQQVSGLRTRA